MKRFLVQCIAVVTLASCIFVLGNTNKSEASSNETPATDQVEITDSAVNPLTYISRVSLEDLEMNQALNELLDEYETQQAELKSQSNNEEASTVQPMSVDNGIVKDILINPNMAIENNGGMEGWSLSYNGSSINSANMITGSFWGVNANRAFQTLSGQLTRLTLSSANNSNFLFAVQSFEGKAGVTYTFKPHIATERTTPTSSTQPSRNYYYGYAYLGASMRNLATNSPAVNSQQLIQGSAGSAEVFSKTISYTPSSVGTVYVIVGGKINFNLADNGFSTRDTLRLRSYKKDENQPPEITSDNQIVIQKDDTAFDIFRPVIKAFDSEDGVYYDRDGTESDTSQIKYSIVQEGTTTVVTDAQMRATAGKYTVTYTITDSFGATATSTTTIILNDPPVINANDVNLYVGDIYNPLNGVTAVDTEDGDITSKLTYKITDSNNVEVSAVDTSKTGVFTVVYSVEDNTVSYDGRTGTATKTITVTVLATAGIMEINDISASVGDQNVQLVARITGTSQVKLIQDGTVVIKYPSSYLQLGASKIMQNGSEITGTASADTTVADQVTITGINADNLDTSPIDVTFTNSEALALYSSQEFDGKLSSNTLTATDKYLVEITEKVGSLELLWVPDLFDFGSHNLENISANTFATKTTLPEYVVVSDSRPVATKTSWRATLTSSVLKEQSSSQEIDALTYRFEKNELKEYKAADDTEKPSNSNIGDAPTSWTNVNVVSSWSNVGGNLTPTTVMQSSSGIDEGKFAMEIQRAELFLPDIGKVTGNNYTGTLTWTLLDAL